MSNTININDVDLEIAKSWGDTKSIDGGLLLTDHHAGFNLPEGPRRLNFIIMALCMKGEAQYSIDTHKHSVHPGELYFISERHIVDYFTASPDFKSLCIMVSTTFYHDFAQNAKNVSSLLLFSMNNPVVARTPAEIQTYNTSFPTIREKIERTEHPYRTELVKALLLSMFYDMSGVIYRVEQQGLKVQSRADVFFSRFIKLLEENFHRERRVSWYADKLNITPKYLSEVVKAVSKRTPTEWIDNYVILELRVLLRNSTKTIKEITDEMYFPNQSFLGKYFKEHVGMSPSEFRKRL